MLKLPSFPILPLCHEAYGCAAGLSALRAPVGRPACTSITCSAWGWELSSRVPHDLPQEWCHGTGVFLSEDPETFRGKFSVNYKFCKWDRLHLPREACFCIKLSLLLLKQTLPIHVRKFPFEIKCGAVTLQLLAYDKITTKFVL